jgi:hypothetical protein
VALALVGIVASYLVQFVETLVMPWQK